MASPCDSADAKRKSNEDPETPAKKKKKRSALTFEEKIALECNLSSTSAHLTRSATGLTDLKKCLVCQEYKPDSSNRRVEEKLTKCVTFEAEFSLLEAARIRSHTLVVNELDGQDGIAKEIVYHRSCLTQDINKRQLNRLLDQAVDSELAENGNVKRQAFSRVIEWIENSSG